mgnify:CR=1 FL=1
MVIKVLLVDDHKIVREGLKALLDTSPDVEVVALAANGTEALCKTAEFSPDVIVMDMSMPEMNGIEATRCIIAENPAAKVLTLSMLLDRGCVLESLKAGAKGYLVKDCAAEELIGAIRALAAGESFLCSKIADLVIKDYMHAIQDELPGSRCKLSRREQEVLQLIADGKSTKEIAFSLGVSIKTIEVQRMNIMKKLNLHSIAELTKYAVIQGLSPLK